MEKTPHIPEKSPSNINSISGSFSRAFEQRTESVEYIKEEKPVKVAAILEFPKQPLLRSEKPVEKNIPEIENINADYNLDIEDAETIGLITQILSYKEFTTKEEEIVGRKADREIAEDIIKNSFQKAMQIAAIKDAETIVFGVKNEEVLYSQFFRKILAASIMKTIDPDECKAILHVYAQMRSLLVNNYWEAIRSWKDPSAITGGGIVTNSDGSNALNPDGSNKIEEGRRNSWKTQLSGIKVHERLKERLHMVLGAYFDHYIMTLWAQKAIRDESTNKPLIQSA